MKILLCTLWAIPHVGGVWHFMQQLKQRFEAMGHQVDMMGNTPDHDKLHIVGRKVLPKAALRPLLEGKLDRAHAPSLAAGTYLRYYEFERYYLELAAAYFGLDQYDVIHTQDVFSARAISRVKPPRTAHVAHLHGSVAVELMMHFQMNPKLGVKEGMPDWEYFRRMEHYGGVSGDVTVTANQWQKRLLVHSYGVPESQIAVYPYGLHVADFLKRAAAPTTVKRPAGKKVIICPARLTFVKGIDVLLTALGNLKARRSDWVCWIVGDGEQRAALEKQTVALGLAKDVFFLGKRSDVPALLAQSDIFVHSCLQDNQPFSVMEAQIAGVPPVVSTAGGLPEMVQHGQTGLICPVRDPVTLANQLALLLGQDGYRKQLGAQAKRWGRAHWSLDRMIKQTMDVYAAALAAKGR